MAISAIGSSSATTADGTSGIKALGAGDFLNLMIKQLQQQDPLNPTDSNQLLTQMSQISNLQSNNAMQTSLQGLTLQQSIGAGGNMIGKHITGIDENGDEVDGTVTSVKIANKKVILETDTAHEVAMENVTNIASTGAAKVAADGTAPADATTPTKGSSGVDIGALLSMLQGAMK